ncbi:N-acetylmuramoyl-L-alanine amidase family protein [Croceiramulus getboli]
MWSKREFRGLILISLCFFAFAKADPVSAQAGKKPFTVVLDAGHGGKDPGKPSKAGYREKDIALKIVLALGKELEKQDDIKIVYTRKTDTFIDLTERGNIANKAEADLFVSIHCNAHYSQAYGAETYVLGLHANDQNLKVAQAENEVIFLEENYEEKYAKYDLNSPESMIGLTLMQEEFLDQSIELASLIQDQFRVQLKRKDRSVKQAAFVVLLQTVMPSVLVETGFITNTQEGKYLASARGQEEMARAMAQAIRTYKANVEANEDLGVVRVEPAAEVVYEDVIFKVQLAASSRALDPEPYNFKGLKELSRMKEGELYKYFYGATSSYTDIQRKLKEARAAGYGTAFIVSFDRNGIKVPIKEVLN